MRPRSPLQRPSVPDGHALACREGRACEASRRVTALMFFPDANARPGGWLLLLATVCAYVAVRALEHGLL